MPVGTEIGLNPGIIVLEGTQLPKKGHSPPIFGPCLLWPNGRPSQLLLSTCSKFYRATPRYRDACRSRVSVCLSVTSRCSTETAKRRITQTKPHKPGTLLFSDAEDLRKTQTGSPPTKAPNAGGVD